MMYMIGVLLAVGLAITHSLSSYIPIFSWLPKHRWTSFAGGVSLTFIFLEVFPELGHAQEELHHSKFFLMHYLENHVYILSLLGLSLFYLLDSAALKARAKTINPNTPAPAHANVFWIHIAAFAGMNATTGYLIQELSHSHWFSCLLFFIAIALHFFIIDEHLLEHHPCLYTKYGRWILAGAVVLGASLGQSTQLDAIGVSLIWAFLAGSIILNVLKRELPDEKESCGWSFLTGILVFSSLLFLK